MNCFHLLLAFRRMRQALLLDLVKYAKKVFDLIFRTKQHSDIEINFLTKLNREFLDVDVLLNNDNNSCNNNKTRGYENGDHKETKNSQKTHKNIFISLT